MEESYREGAASRPGPEPCGGGRKAAPEALDRGICRLGIELRNKAFRGADRVGSPGMQPQAEPPRERAAVPAKSKAPGMQRNSMRENREPPLPPAATKWRGGRSGAPTPQHPS